MSEHEVGAADNIPQASPGNAATRRDAIALWTGILGGPLLWLAHQQISFVLVPWVCAHGGVAWLHAATLAGVAGTGAAAGLAWRRTRRQRMDAGETASAGEQRVHFMAVLGLLNSAFFGFVILAQGLPNFLLDPCQR